MLAPYGHTCAQSEQLSKKGTKYKDLSLKIFLDVRQA